MSKIAEAAIYRPQTAEEARDFKDINKRTIQDVFRTTLISFEQKATKERKPYCAKCAKIDFEDWHEKIAREAVRNAGNRKKAVVEYDIKSVIDFSSYGTESRFKLLNKSDAMEPVRRGERTIQEKIGENWDYECQVNSCMRTVFVPNSALPKTKPDEEADA